MESVTTTLPFKVNQTTIVIVKYLPVSQCTGCREYLLDDVTMEQVEDILQHVDETAELEVLKYAA
jgi:YgiT-type zinc finger domain-containing protein